MVLYQPTIIGDRAVNFVDNYPALVKYIKNNSINTASLKKEYKNGSQKNKDRK